MHNMKINENTKWGEVDKDLEFLDHPAFPKPDVYKTRQKPRVAVMGYNKDDIPGGDIGGDSEPEYTANGEINPFHGIDSTLSYNVKKDKWEPEGMVEYVSEEPSYTDVIYEGLEKAQRQIVRLESKLLYKDQQIKDLQEQLKEFYNE